MVKILEWLAFSMSLMSVFSYGKWPRHAPKIGMSTAVVFLLWSYLKDVPAGLITNCAFFALHFNNHRKVVNASRTQSSQ